MIKMENWMKHPMNRPEVDEALAHYDASAIWDQIDAVRRSSWNRTHMMTAHEAAALQQWAYDVISMASDIQEHAEMAIEEIQYKDAIETLAREGQTI